MSHAWCRLWALRGWMFGRGWPDRQLQVKAPSRMHIGLGGANTGRGETKGRRRVRRRPPARRQGFEREFVRSGLAWQRPIREREADVVMRTTEVQEGAELSARHGRAPALMRQTTFALLAIGQDCRLQPIRSSTSRTILDDRSVAAIVAAETMPRATRRKNDVGERTWVASSW